MLRRRTAALTHAYIVLSLLAGIRTLGVITEAWMRVQARPRFRAGASVSFADFADADLGSGQLVMAQLPQVLRMGEASHGSQVRPLPRAAARQSEPRAGQDAHDDSMGMYGAQ